LSITKQLVELHGGTIDVESEIDGGSRFFFTIPVFMQSRTEVDLQIEPDPSSVREGVNVTTGNDPFPAGPVPVGSDRGEPEVPRYGLPGMDGDLYILAIDDEPVNMQVLSNIFLINNVTIQKAYNGPQALEIIETHGMPDLILLDIMMPGMNGYELCRLIREQYPANRLPVIMLTAKNQISDLVDALEAGASDYISKPFSKNELLSRIKLHLNLAALNRKEGFIAVGQMASEILHDLTTPMYAIRIATALAKKDPTTPVKQIEYFDAIEKEAVRLSEITDDILKYVNKGQHLELSEENSAQFAKELEEEFRLLVTDKNIGISFNTVYQGTIVIDKKLMRRVIENIVRNAVEALKDTKGEISIEIRKKSKDLIFSIRDNGPGIPVENRKRIFEPLVSYGKNTGSGLGLSIAKRIVESHQGKIWFSSGEDKGTVFYISLPL